MLAHRFVFSVFHAQILAFHRPHFISGTLPEPETNGLSVRLPILPSLAPLIARLLTFHRPHLIIPAKQTKYLAPLLILFQARGRTIIAHVSPREHKLTFASLAESFPTGVIIISSPKLFTKTHSPSLRQLPALHLCSLHGQPSPIVQLESSPTFRKNHCPHKGRIVAHISSPQTFQGNTQDLHFMHLPLLHRSLPRKESSPTFHLPKLPTKT